MYRDVYIDNRQHDERPFVGNVYFSPKGCMRLIFAKIENKYYRLGHRYVVIFIIVNISVQFRRKQESMVKGNRRKIHEMEKSHCVYQE